MTNDCNWTFALLTPDGVLSARLDPVVACLANHGFHVRASLLVDLDVRKIAGIYTPPPGTPERKKSSCVRIPLHLYEGFCSLAPACLLMLHHPKGDASERIIECKGYTRPEAASPGTVRHMGENVLLNLLHAPDDTAGAVRELAIIAGERDADRLVSVARGMDGTAPEDLLGLRAVRESLPAAYHPMAVSFAAVGNKLRRRVLARTAIALYGNQGGIPILQELSKVLSSEAEALAERTTSRQRLTAAQAVNDRWQALWRELPGNAVPETTRQAMDALSSLYDISGERDPDRVLSLREDGIHVSPSEEVVLRSHAHTFVPCEDLNSVHPL